MCCYFNADFANIFSSYLLKEISTLRFQHFTEVCPFLITLKRKTLENIGGEGENAGIHHFLLFLQYCYEKPLTLYQTIPTLKDSGLKDP